MDIHTLQGLKDEFLDLLPIFKTTTWSRQDASSHRAEYCEAAGVTTSWRFTLNSSHFAHQMLIPTPLLCQCLLKGLSDSPVCPTAVRQASLPSGSRSVCINDVRTTCAFAKHTFCHGTRGCQGCVVQMLQRHDSSAGAAPARGRSLLEGQACAKPQRYAPGRLGRCWR